MKKIYFKPEISLEDMECQEMIALSRKDTYADSEGEVLSREDNSWGSNSHSVWDDDEED
jgi:hypothetical protein